MPVPLRAYGYIVVSALLFGSCMVSMSEEEQAEHLLQAPSLETSADSSLALSYYARADWPEEAWWEVFGSEQLNGLMRKALEQNPSIEAVRAKIVFAKEQAVVVGSQLYPIVYFDGSDMWDYLSKNGLYRALNPTIGLSNSQIDFSLSFTFELDFWGKYRNLYYAALGREKATEAETAQVELIETTALATAYFALKTNLLRQKLYKELLDVRKKDLAVQKMLLRHSLYSKLPPLLAQEKVDQAEQWVYDIEKEIAVDRHLVNLLVGLGPDDLLEVNSVLPPLPAKLAIPNNLSAELVSRRPDLMAQIWRVDALAHEVGAARAEFWPDFNLSGLAGFQSGSWSSIFNWASKTLSLTPAFSLPVYTAGEIAANADAKKALFDEALYQYNELLLKSFQEVADVLAISKAVYLNKARQDSIVESARARYELTALRQQHGLEGALTIYNYLEELIQKQLDDVQLLYSQYVVCIRLIRSLGGGYCSVKEEV